MSDRNIPRYLSCRQKIDEICKEKCTKSYRTCSSYMIKKRFPHNSTKNYVFSCSLLKLLLILQNVVSVTYKVPASCLPFYLVPLVPLVFLLLQTAVSTDFWKS